MDPDGSGYHSITSSHQSASLESAQKPAKRAGLRDVGLMIFVNFLSFVCFAIVLPSLWPFLKSFHQPKSMVGYAVAINSFGTFLGSPILGKWADWRGVRESIGVSLVIMIVGNVAYALSYDVWMLLAARFVVGFAGGNYAPASAYLSYATDEQHRQIAMGANSAAGILGFILGPTIAAMLAFLPHAKSSITYIEFNDLTSPGWASVGLSLLALPFLLTFRDIRPGEDSAASVADSSAASHDSTLPYHLHHSGSSVVGEDAAYQSAASSSYHEAYGAGAGGSGKLYAAGAGAGGSGVANAKSSSPAAPQVKHVTFGDIPSTMYSTNHGGNSQGAPPANAASYPTPAHYSYSYRLPGSQKHIAIESHFSAPTIAAIGPINAQKSLKQFSSLRRRTMFAVVICLIVQFWIYLAYTVFETIGTPYTQQDFGWDVLENGGMFAVVGVLCIGALIAMQVALICISERMALLLCNFSMIIGYGLLIDYPFTKLVYYYRFIPGVALSSMGFAAGAALLIALFSKILGDQEQGLMMGWLSASGSFARVVGPLFASYTLQYGGGSLVFLIVTGSLLLNTLALLIGFPWLKPRTQVMEEMEDALLADGPKPKSFAPSPAPRASGKADGSARARALRSEWERSAEAKWERVAAWKHEREVEAAESLISRQSSIDGTHEEDAQW